MSKVVLTLGNTPADCSLRVDGEKIENVTSISATVDVENGPVVSYRTTEDSDVGPVEEIHDVEFKVVTE